MNLSSYPGPNVLVMESLWLRTTEVFLAIHHAWASFLLRSLL
ncbi:protein of unknown function [Burkholderia multivorans]